MGGRATTGAGVLATGDPTATRLRSHEVHVWLVEPAPHSDHMVLQALDTTFCISRRLSMLGAEVTSSSCTVSTDARRTSAVRAEHGLLS